MPSSLQQLIRDAQSSIAEGHFPTLVPAAAALTGNVSLLRTDLLPERPNVLARQGGMSRDQRERAAAAVLDALVTYWEAGSPVADAPSSASLEQMVQFAAGGVELDPGYLPLLQEELGFDGADPRAPSWRLKAAAPGREFRVAVIGAGMSGLLAAHRLRQAGIDVTVLEKNGEVGGTWLDNVYPGCRVDVPSHLYSYSFLQRTQWPRLYSTQAALLDYFRSGADELGLRDLIRLNTEVLGAEWSDDSGTWAVAVRSPDGDGTIRVNAVISAVGQLNRPSIPTIPGAETFAGTAMHSARWDPAIDLAGKRVAVIGTGASAAQLVPPIAQRAEHTTIFQRSPAWLLPTPDYHDAMSEGQQWLFEHVPGYSQWYRFGLFLSVADGLLPAAKVDPAWDEPGSVSAMNDELRVRLTTYLQAEFQERPDLLAKCVPDYPPGGKRLIRDNGSWSQALRRDDVELTAEAIERIEPGAVVTRDGVAHSVEVIVYATGFQASDFLTPMRITGRDGRDLHATWAGDASAFNGVTVPGFPNLFLLYGPNTNFVLNGSAIFLSECEMSYILGCLELIVKDGHLALDCRPEAFLDYNRRIDGGNALMAWGIDSVDNWYKNSTGRVSQNWPYSLLEFWQCTRRPDPAHYVALESTTAERTGPLVTY